MPEVVSQPALLEALVSDAAAKSASFSFVRGASVKEVLREDGRIVGVRAAIAERNSFAQSS